MEPTVETLVVGAGISGLVYAHERLREDPDADLLIVDTAQEPGGLVRTVRESEPVALRYEAGPETIADPSGGARALAADLGLERVSATSDRRFVLHKGELVEVPVSPPAFLKSSLLPVSARLRMLTEPMRSGKVALNGSIADFVRHRLGKHVLETLVDPVIGGIHAGDPEQISMRACFPAVVEGVERHGSLVGFFKSRAGKTDPQDRTPWKPAGGMGALSDALAKGLGERLRLGQTVTGLTRLAPEPSGGWRVELGTETLHASRLVLALPARATARLLDGVLPTLATILTDMPMENLLVVSHAHTRASVRHALDGFGYLVPSKAGLAHLGTLFSSTLDPDCIDGDHVLLRTMLGGSRPGPSVDAPEQEILASVRQEVGPLLGLEWPPAFAAVSRHPAVLPRYDLDHLDRLARLDGDMPEDLSLLGNHQHGIGLSALLRDSRDLAQAHAAQVEQVSH